jgi:hypothetical protein
VADLTDRLLSLGTKTKDAKKKKGRVDIKRKRGK